MKEKLLKILEESYPKITQRDKENFAKIIKDDGLGKCRPLFHPWAFIFGWFYLLYRRAVLEAFGVLIFSLMIGYLMASVRLHPVLILGAIFIVNSIVGGFCYYFLYLNKFSRDLDNCGEYNPEPECMKERAKPKISYVIYAVIIIILFIWPWIFALVTGQNLHG
jgi:hypothetical protein